MAHADAAVTLDHRQALAIPLASSFSLLALFYFFKSLQLILMLLLCLGSIYALFFAAYPSFEGIVAKRTWLRQRLVFCSSFHVPVGDALLAGASVLTVFMWLLTGSMALNNLLGIALCISFVAMVRIPNLKVCSYLLGALFVYDCFWVFFSERFFGSNVMVEAATQLADNPAFQVAEVLHLPSESIAPHLDLPVKLLFPQSLLQWNRDDDAAVLMLGLGDIALPGMLIALLLGDDVLKWRRAAGPGADASGESLKMLRSSKFWRDSYVMPSWLGYCIGMFAALGVGTVLQAPQPALFYLVPATLLPVGLRARRRGELRSLWEGLESDKEVDV